MAGTKQFGLTFSSFDLMSFHVDVMLLGAGTRATKANLTKQVHPCILVKWVY